MKTVAMILSLLPSAAWAADLTVPLASGASVERKTVQYRCDASGVSLGLPDGPFLVEYINGGGNALAVVPIGRKPIIFAGVIAASGSRFAAGRLVWWDAGDRGITLTGDGDAGKIQSDCKLADKT